MTTTTGTFYGGARLVGLAAVDVSPLSMVSPQLSKRRVRAEQGETERGRPLDVVIPGAALPELMQVYALLKMGEGLSGGWTVRSVLTVLKDFYIRRNQVAANWDREVRRLRGKAKVATEWHMAMERELYGTKRRLDTMAGRGARYRGQLQSWAEWYAHHRECCLVAPKERQVGTLQDRRSSASMSYTGRSGTLFGSASFGGTPCYHRGNVTRADVENDDRDAVLVSSPEK